MTTRTSSELTIGTRSLSLISYQSLWFRGLVIDNWEIQSQISGENPTQSVRKLSIKLNPCGVWAARVHGTADLQRVVCPWICCSKLNICAVCPSSEVSELCKRFDSFGFCSSALILTGCYNLRGSASIDATISIETESLDFFQNKDSISNNSSGSCNTPKAKFWFASVLSKE